MFTMRKIRMHEMLWLRTTGTSLARLEINMPSMQRMEHSSGTRGPVLATTHARQCRYRALRGRPREVANRTLLSGLFCCARQLHPAWLCCATRSKHLLPLGDQLAVLLSGSDEAFLSARSGSSSSSSAISLSSLDTEVSLPPPDALAWRQFRPHLPPFPEWFWHEPELLEMFGGELGVGQTI